MGLFYHTPIFISDSWGRETQEVWETLDQTILSVLAGRFTYFICVSKLFPM